MWLRILAGAALAVSTTAHAATCWITLETPRTGDQLAVTDARVAPMRAVAQRIHAILRSNAELASLPATRLRSRWQIGGQFDAPARSLWYQARNHRKEMWVGECGVHEQADRIEPTASIVVHVNATADLFNGPPVLRDERLTAWRSPEIKGETNGRPIYHGWMVVLGANGRPPWVDVTQAEYLDYVERDIARRRATIEENHRALAASPSQEEMTRRVYENLRKINPAEAEKFLELQRREAAAPARKGPDRNRDLAYVDQQLASVRAFRAGLSAEVLAAPARLGWTGERPDANVQGPRIAKLDPNFPWDARNPQKPRVIAVLVQGRDEFEAPMQRVMQTLDWTALEALVR